MAISCKLMGRTANQMFIYAATIATSLKYNIPYCIPTHTMNDEVWKPLKFENVNYCGDEIGHNLRAWETWAEPSHAYTEIPEPNMRQFRLQGFFQSELYFKDYLPEIRKAFGFDCSVKNKRVVALHQRLGDYRLYPTKHVINSDDYIKKALSIMYEKGYRECMVFSDEIYECVRTINKEKYPEWNFSYSVGRDEIKDLQEMINCESFIISASTFSLMASILSESENKICIAPKKWFNEGNSNLDTSTICPENYIRL